MEIINRHSSPLAKSFKETSHESKSMRRLKKDAFNGGQELAARSLTPPPQRPSGSLSPVQPHVPISEKFPAFFHVLQRLYPSALHARAFLQLVEKHLGDLGFNKSNTIPFVTLCRDENTKPFRDEIKNFWCRDQCSGGAFDCSGLAGMGFLGRSLMDFCKGHAYESSDNQHRYLFLAMTHIAIDKDGRVGKTLRPGRKEESSACGALCAFQGELQSGKYTTDSPPQFDQDDVEASLLKQRLFKMLKPNSKPDLWELTNVAVQAIYSDLYNTVTNERNLRPFDFVLLVGIQVHGPEESTFIFPTTMTASVAGVEHDIQFSHSERIGSDGDLPIHTRFPVFFQKLQEHFPAAVTAQHFLDATANKLSAFGFQKGNTMPAVSLCRDDITRAFYAQIQRQWQVNDSFGNFDFSSLGGFLFMGKTGMGAANHHAPQFDGLERYLYIAMPHIAIDDNGDLGKCQRSGRRDSSTACEALVSFLDELTSGTFEPHGPKLDPEDLEQSLVNQKLFKHIPYGSAPDLAQLTKIASDVILEDLENIIAAKCNPEHAHWAVVTGVQVHGPEDCMYIFPGTMYAVLHGHKYPFDLYSRPPSSDRLASPPLRPIHSSRAPPGMFRHITSNPNGLYDDMSAAQSTSRKGISHAPDGSTHLPHIHHSPHTYSNPPTERGGSPMEALPSMRPQSREGAAQSRSAHGLHQSHGHHAHGSTHHSVGAGTRSSRGSGGAGVHSVQSHGNNLHLYATTGGHGPHHHDSEADSDSDALSPSVRSSRRSHDHSATDSHSRGRSLERNAKSSKGIVSSSTEADALGSLTRIYSNKMSLKLPATSVRKW